MTDPIVVRINKFMTRDDFRHASEELKMDNPNIIVLPAEYELLYPDVIPVTRCKDCRHYRGDHEYCENDMFAVEDGFCNWAERKNSIKP